MFTVIQSLLIATPILWVAFGMSIAIRSTWHFPNGMPPTIVLAKIALFQIFVMPALILHGARGHNVVEMVRGDGDD